MAPVSVPMSAPKSVPVPSPEERRANAVYDAMLWALSRPGLVRTLPEAGAAQIVEALIDRECRVHAADPALVPAIRRSGAQVTALGAADHVFLGTLADPAALHGIARGSDLYPDEGATVVVTADLAHGPRLGLSGPGIDGALEVVVGGLPDGFWQQRARLIRYPMGFEIFLIDGNRIMGLPRSTAVEVL
ncbi:MAG: phosphonate C-P lyase system protein PhnH [Pseudomonadota bacterium]